VKTYDEESYEVIDFISTSMEIGVLDIANLYRNRWNIRGFQQMDKAEPSHQKAVWGYSPNTVKTQPLGRHLLIPVSRPRQSQTQQPLFLHRARHAHQRLGLGKSRPEGTPHDTFRPARIKPKCQRTRII